MESKAMAGHVIRRLHQISTHVFSENMRTAGFDLTPVQFAAMDAIRTTPGADQAHVAAQIGYDRATIGGVIDRLEKKGLVERTVSARDRRAREVRLSDEGNRVLDAMLPVVIALQRDVLAGLDDAETAEFMRLAAKAVRATEDL